MGVTIKFYTKEIVNQFRNIQRDDIPLAQIAAGRDAAKKSITQAKRVIAKDAKVASKYVKSRFTASGGYKKKRTVNAAVTFRYLNINPAGTKKYPNAMKTLHRITKTGKRGKGHGNIKAMGRTYQRAFIYSKGGKYRVPLILQRKGKSAYPIEKKTIELGSVAVTKVTRIVQKIAPPYYAKRFEYHFNRRMSRRGAR